MENCPSKAITRLDQDYPPYVSIEDCLGCGYCIDECPVKAIEIIYT